MQTWCRAFNSLVMDGRAALPDIWPWLLSHTRLRRRPVMDVLTWIECFSVMSMVTSSKFPDRAPKLFVYMRTIAKTSQTFDGLAWVAYDNQFRQKAAANRSWDWGSIDTALYNECFTGRTRMKVLCKTCASESHAEQQCTLTTPTLACSRPCPCLLGEWCYYRHKFFVQR